MNGEIEEIKDFQASEFLDHLIRDAVGQSASDIHIEPQADYTAIRFRIDGELVHIMDYAPMHHSSLVTRIMIMGGIDIADRRKPQDGGFTFDQEKGIDLRIAILPTIFGEKAVIRILCRDRYKMGLEDFGFSEEALTGLRRITSRSGGMLISSGPTGCGKSTTLYALLNELNSENRSILTIEDPVEYKIEGISQMQVNDKAGLGFATGLRSMLRADPDIIMVGEIRDRQTAETAIRAAITGHFVLSTIHTYDSFSAIIRLLDMGIEPYLIASALAGVQSQRLVRKLCPHCSRSRRLNDQEQTILSNFTEPESDAMIKEPVGCDHCIEGYGGRQVITELFEVDADFIEAIKRRDDIAQLRHLGAKKGIRTMLEDGLDRAMKGELYLQELLRSVYRLSGDSAGSDL